MTQPPIYKRSSLATPLSQAVEKLTRPVFRKHGLAEARLITEWREIAGPVLAKHSLPIKLSFPRGKREGGTLYVRVASGWALEIQHLEPQILDKIATYFGYRAVGALKIQQGPLPHKPEKPKKTTLPPLSAEQANVLESATAKVEEDELKAALKGLGEAILRKQPPKS